MAISTSLTNVTTFQNDSTAVAAVTANNAAITTSLQDGLSRSGSSPNQMNATLDMNSNQIVNLPAPLTTSSPVRLTDLNTVIAGGTISSLPAGGTTGQVLSKHSSTNYDVQWSSTGAGQVSSVGLALPADFTITNSPVTTTGTLTGSWAVAPTGTGAVVKSTSPSLTTPVMASIVNGGTLTLPTTTDTLVGRNTTDPLTNKTISGASNTLSNVALSSLNTQAAWSLTGNNTSGAASPAAFTIGSLTQKVTPAATDFVIIQDQAASGALKYATVSSVGASSGVSSLNGQIGTVVSYFQPQGRLTLLSGSPVMSSTGSGSQNSKTTLYYTPYVGNLCPIYDGTNMIPTAFSETSVLTTDNTKNPSVIGASKVNDWFIWNDGGTIRLSHGPDWTNDTTRSAGTALVTVSGIILNNVSITNGPAAQRGTYVGTTRSDGSSTLNFTFGASASGGTAGNLAVWNMYNRVSVGTDVQDTGTSYTYSSLTIRQARASAGMQVSFVVGQPEDSIWASYASRVTLVSAAGAFFQGGLGYDATNAFSGQSTILMNVAASPMTAAIASTKQITPSSGYHFIAALETSDVGNSNTFNAASLGTLSALIRM